MHHSMIVLRHCESEFNRLFTLTGRDPGIADPLLSAHGRAHAESLIPELMQHKIRRIIVSPFSRAMETALPVARHLDIVPEVQPLIRERALYSCDVGSSPAHLAEKWPELDFSSLEETWWTERMESVRETEFRAREFCRQVASTSDADETLVVSHWAFLLTLTGESMENGTWRFFSP